MNKINRLTSLPIHYIKYKTHLKKTTKFNKKHSKEFNKNKQCCIHLISWIRSEWMHPHRYFLHSSQTMVLILDGNSEHFAQVWCQNRALMKSQSKKCSEKIKLPISFNKCVTISELLSNISTMSQTGLKSTEKGGQKREVTGGRGQKRRNLWFR